jgi:hypothetical protein
LIGCRAGFDPVGWQQGFEIFRRGVVHQLLEEPLEVAEGIRAMATAEPTDELI